MGAPVLDENMARQIKARLWEGDKTVDISYELGISQALVSNVKTGRSYFDASWPDGSHGGMPEYRRLQLMKSRQRESITAKRLGGNNEYIAPEVTAQWIKDYGMTPEEFCAEGMRRWLAQENERKQAELMEMARLSRERLKNRPPVIDNTPKPRTAIDPSTEEKLPWERVLELGHDLPVVLTADQGDDQDLKDAIATVMWLVGPSYWKDSTIFLRLIGEIKAKYVAWREQNDLALTT